MDKLYICVLNTVPDHMTPVLVAHAVLRHHLCHVQRKPEYRERYDAWLKDSFKKCVVRVNQKEFDKINQLPNTVESWENSVFDGGVTCVTIVASSDDHNVLKFAKLWKPLNG